MSIRTRIDKLEQAVNDKCKDNFPCYECLMQDGSTQMLDPFNAMLEAFKDTIVKCVYHPEKGIDTNKECLIALLEDKYSEYDPISKAIEFTAGEQLTQYMD